MHRPAPLALITCLLLLAACGDAPRNGTPQPTAAPAQTAEAFFAAIDADDTAGYEAQMTPAAIKALHADDGASMNFSSDKLDTWEVGVEAVDGDEAAVPVVVTSDGREQPLSLKLRRQDGRWLVYAMAIPMGDDEWLIDFEGGNDTLSQMGEELVTGLAEGLTESLTQAFEDAAAEWQAGGSADEIAAGRASFDALVSVSQAQHNEAWQVDVEAGGRPATEVIAELIEGTGLTMAATDLLDSASTLSLAGVSRLAAIEALCAEAGVVPVYPNAMSGAPGDSPGLTFRSGARTRPAVFEGPFLIDVTDLEEHAPHTTGELEITVLALGLHPAILAANQQMAEYLELGTVKSSRGDSLRADNVHWMGSPTIAQGLFSYSLSPDLSGLLSSVESLSVEGEVVIALPEDVHLARFPAGPTGNPTQSGPWTVVWKQNGTSGSFTLTHSDEKSTQASVRFAPDFASGEPMGIQSESASHMFDHVSASLSTPEIPASLALKTFTSREQRYRFRLDDIPLAHFAEQPVRRTPLTFEGLAPLTVGFTRFADRTDANFPKVDLRVRNPSNLDVTNAQVTFEYLDAAGKSLKDFSHSLSGVFTAEGAQPLAAAGQTTTLETTAFFMPPETAALRVRVESVDFVNGTTWKRDE